MLLATARELVEPLAVTLKPRKRGVTVEVGTLTRFGATVVRALIENLGIVAGVNNPTVGRGDTRAGGVRAELRVDLQRVDGPGGNRFTAEHDTSTADVLTPTSGSR